ncbi:hypothetical protein GCM10007094_28990 [Pseudovibrio japonicus]|uniref:Uncharacterized protein n=1 Tax=Pseudovibrio japonicus TaxID=366534 RepID=A0ABQ3EP07_9HYPH|nr:DUF6544 family protein [Pseudovibrio japonicus]GHB37864.1 hypothetical protein GCM10007094_28990 [Pseudovibrio japonicus]
MRILKISFALSLSAIALTSTYVAYSTWQTEADIKAHRQNVIALAQQTEGPNWDNAALSTLPKVVQRYLQFSFPNGPTNISHVSMEMEGQFRRPQTEGFAATTAEQVVAANTPALAFSATTPIIPGVWARAYDAYADVRMEMKAKILSTITVVDEKETPELNATSLRRWLLESPLYPVALMPGGPVTWEAIDDTRARATVTMSGYSASLVATFREDGSLERFDAEEDGDLTSPYHGSGEHVYRTDYKEVSGMMIPHKFIIARAAKGKILPFWNGHLTSITFSSL